MLIVADAGILSVDRLFQRFGKLLTYPGRGLTSAHLLYADALLIRSITRVDEKLLKNTPVNFVGSATSGTDHVDTEYLRGRGIRFAHAKGSNANAVVEYCFTALSLLNCLHGIEILNKRVALVGAGFVGGRFAEKLSSLGCECLVCDPYLSGERQEELQMVGCRIVDLDEALSANVISLHVPLTHSGDYPTFHLLNEKRLQDLPSNTVLINTSRGEVIDNNALACLLKDGKKIFTVLDVWENEPHINIDLLSRVTIASPHIAGYSVEAKHQATVKLLRAFGDHYSIDISSNSCEEDTEKLELPDLTLKINSGTLDEFGCELLNTILPLVDIDRLFRQGCISNREKQVEVFDDLRKTMATRREFCSYSLPLHIEVSQPFERLSKLGFNF